MREKYTCSDTMLKNAVIAHVCGYPKLLQKVKNKYDVTNNKKRKCGGRVLVRNNANKYAHCLT